MRAKFFQLIKLLFSRVFLVALTVLIEVVLALYFVFKVNKINNTIPKIGNITNKQAQMILCSGFIFLLISVTNNKIPIIDEPI